MWPGFQKRACISSLRPLAAAGSACRWGASTTCLFSQSSSDQAIGSLYLFRDDAQNVQLSLICLISLPSMCMSQTEKWARTTKNIDQLWLKT